MSDPSGNDQSSDSPEAIAARPRAARKNLFLSATIESGDLKVPVRIRNLSETGAMIDGAALPEIGATLILRRLEIEIGATTVWRMAGRAGIRFDGTASVDEWVAGVRQAHRPEERGQTRVDIIQSAVRSGAPLPAGDEAAPIAPLEAGAVERRIAEELAYVKRLLDSIGDELVDDPIILQRHGQALQNFDIACQILAHLGTIVGAPDREAAVKAVTMQELRARLLRK